MQTITLDSNSGPAAIAITPDNQFAFVTNISTGTISVIDVSTLSVMKTITLDGNSSPIAIAITPDNRYAFVVNMVGTVFRNRLSTCSHANNYRR